MQKWQQLSDSDQHGLRLSFFGVPATKTLQDEFAALMESADTAWNLRGFRNQPLVKVNVLVHLAMLAYVNQAPRQTRLPRTGLDWVVEEFDQRRRYKLVVYAKQHPVVLWRETGTQADLELFNLASVLDWSKRLAGRLVRNAAALEHKLPAVGTEFYL